MSIKLIARELYRFEKEIGELEKRLMECRQNEREVLEDSLRKVRAERNRMRKILDGAKDDPPYRLPR